MRRKLTWYTALTTLAVCVVGTLVWRGIYRPIASFNLGNGRSVSIWSEWVFDGLGARLLMCEVRDADGLVGRMGLGGHWGHESYEFRVVFADDKALSSVYVVNCKPGSDGFFVIICDARSREWYPGLRDDETMWMPHVNRKWVERYARLRAENPELPEVKTLTEEYWAERK